MTLHATAVGGNPEVMLECLVQEYAWMGWDAKQILRLFRDPYYPALHALFLLWGEDGIRERVAAVIGSTGVFQFEGTVHDEPERSEPELIELGMPSRPISQEGNSHA
jgi:hypothetical protein